MVTLRAYSNPAEAALAKTLLDDRNILCSLADENSYLYGGAPLAMPVRILVAEEQAQEADRILRDAAGNQIEFTTETTEELTHEKFPARELQPSLPPGINNPWEILAVAALLLLPGLTLLLQKHELVLVGPPDRSGRYLRTFFSQTAVHLIGILVIAVALLLTILFFYIRRVNSREEPEVKGKGDQDIA
jgi:hypothetical protein